MEFRNRTKETFDWNTDNDLDGLIEPYHGSPPDLAAELPVVLMYEYNPGPISDVETETLDPNAITADTDAKSGIKIITVVYDCSNTPTPIFTNQPKT